MTREIKGTWKKNIIEPRNVQLCMHPCWNRRSHIYISGQYVQGDRLMVNLLPLGVSAQLALRIFILEHIVETEVLAIGLVQAWQKLMWANKAVEEAECLALQTRKKLNQKLELIGLRTRSATSSRGRSIGLVCFPAYFAILLCS